MKNTIYIEGIKGLNKEIATSANLINMLRANYKLCLQGYLRTGENEHVIVCKTDMDTNIINLYMDEIVESINNMISKQEILNKLGF